MIDYSDEDIDKMDLDDDEVEDPIPNVVDPCWEKMSAPVLAFFSEPRDWAAIREWAKTRTQTIPASMLGHCVAWLEEQGLARSFLRDGKIIWVATNIRAGDTFTEEPSAESPLVAPQEG